LLMQIFPHIKSSEEVQVEEIGEGSYNRVYGLTIPVRPPPSNPGTIRVLRTGQNTEQFVLRIPINREEMGEDVAEEISREIATLRVVNTRLQIETPRLIQYSTRAENILGKPYVIQTRLRGRSLFDLWESLNNDQLASAIHQITGIVEHITGFGRGWTSCGPQVLSKFPNPVFVAPTTWSAPLTTPTVFQMPIEWMVEQSVRWMAYEQAEEVDEYQLIWSELVKIARSLDREGWLGRDFKLMHNDLYARSIMAVVVNDRTVEITGVLDWDRACFAPESVALRAPYWAWSKDDSEDSVNDELFYPDDEACKNAFLEAASEDFKKFSFSAKAILVRKLFKHFVWGVMHPQQQAGARELIDDVAHQGVFRLEDVDSSGERNMELV
ncbi:hypothetical protein CC86DRAFT_283194, partial [Ophiobolus disseminans]